MVRVSVWVAYIVRKSRLKSRRAVAQTPLGCHTATGAGSAPGKDKSTLCREPHEPAGCVWYMVCKGKEITDTSTASCPAACLATYSTISLSLCLLISLLPRKLKAREKAAMRETSI